MSLNLMTGYAGEPHITSADDGAVNAAIYGASKYVLNTGQKFAYELISNNLIKIKDGYAMNQGRKIGQAVNDYEELTIDNGLQGVKRSDIIAIRYSKNPDTGIESAEFIVIKGTSGDDYKDPACQTGNIIQGDLIDDFPLYRIKIDGINITAVEPMFDVLMSMEEIQRKYDDILGIQDISKIGDGTVTGAIYEINSNSEWKLLGDTTGSTALTLPPNYSEILASVSIDGNPAWAYSIHITKKEVDDGVQNFYSGFMFHTDTTGGCRVTVENNTIFVSTIWYKNSDVINKTLMRVYYR